MGNAMPLPPPGPVGAPRPKRAPVLARTEATLSGGRAHPTGGGRMSSVCSRSEAAFAAAGSGPRPPRSAAVPDRRPCSAPAGQPVPERSPAFGAWPPPMARCRPRQTQAPRGPLPGRRQAWRGRRGRSQWSRAETRLPSLESLSSGGPREPGRETPSPTRSSRTGPRSRRFPSRDRSWGRGTARRCWRAASARDSSPGPSRRPPRRFRRDGKNGIVKCPRGKALRPAGASMRRLFFHARQGSRGMSARRRLPFQEP